MLHDNHKVTVESNSIKVFCANYICICEKTQIVLSGVILCICISQCVLWWAVVGIPVCNVHDGQTGGQRGEISMVQRHTGQGQRCFWQTTVERWVPTLICWVQYVYGKSLPSWKSFLVKLSETWNALLIFSFLLLRSGKYYNYDSSVPATGSWEHLD